MRGGCQKPEGEPIAELQIIAKKAQDATGITTAKSFIHRTPLNSTELHNRLILKGDVPLTNSTERQRNVYCSTGKVRLSLGRGWTFAAVPTESNMRLADIDQITKPGRHADGGGLYLLVRPSGARSWSYGYRAGKAVREIGLGTAAGPGREGLSLAEAREKAAALRQTRRDGADPLALKRAEKAKAEAANDATTFGEFARLHIETVLKPGFKSPKTAEDWRRSLEIHAKPIMGLRFPEITTDHIESILRPIWQTKPKTAAELRGRVERIIDAARVKKLCTGENPARWRGNMREIMPKLRRGKRHLPAIPYADMPGVIARLQAERHADNISNDALEFTILTAVRTTEARAMVVGEVDFASATWIIPAIRMKAEKDFKVPLSPRAVQILKDRIPDDAKRGDYVFKGLKPGQCLGHNAMAHALQRIVQGFTVHGCRSTMRDWIGDETDWPRELAEQCLAHAAGDAVETAYRRGSAFSKRRKIMEAWADFCAGAPQADS